VLLAESSDEALANAANATLSKLPAPILGGALTPDLHPAVVATIAPRYVQDVAVAEKFLMLPQILGETVAEMARTASEMVSELIATNEARLLTCPKIIEALYMNKKTRMSTADRIVELAVRNQIEVDIPAFAEVAKAIAGELIPEATAEPSFDDEAFAECTAMGATSPDEEIHETDAETGEERIKKEFEAQKIRFEDLTASGKIRAALLGTAPERMMALRDTNPIVRAAAVKSPLLTDQDLVRITANKNANEDVLRAIAASRDKMKQYQVKFNLVANPRTPVGFSSRLIPHLREPDLKILSRSRDVPGAVQKMIKEHLSKRQ
jgi:hypothetical protein